MDANFVVSLHETVAAKVWEINEGSTDSDESKSPKIKLRTGIVGIERSLQERQKQTDESITVAFQDLSKLMGMAQDMVNITKVISNKIRTKQGDISEDETVRFKSYLLSLGIDDPVTKENFRSDDEYHQKLSQQICQMMLDPLTVL